tara:strand:- start:6681 stop:7127 length:447 start_codon:yes stop_codon:yes gene_type:complete
VGPALEAHTSVTAEAMAAMADQDPGAVMAEAVALADTLALAVMVLPALTVAVITLRVLLGPAVEVAVVPEALQVGGAEAAVRDTLGRGQAALAVLEIKGVEAMALSLLVRARGATGHNKTTQAHTERQSKVQCVSCGPEVIGSSQQPT